MGNIVELESLVGLTISNVKGLEAGSEEVVFTLSDGRAFKMGHYFECCESVYLADICGDVEDLVDAKIVHFVERVSEKTDEEAELYHADSLTWTFYDIQTSNGCVNLRWDGESNGCYSESVDVEWELIQ